MDFDIRWPRCTWQETLKEVRDLIYNKIFQQGSSLQCRKIDESTSGVPYNCMHGFYKRGNYSYLFTLLLFQNALFIIHPSHFVYNSSTRCALSRALKLNCRTAATVLHAPRSRSTLPYRATRVLSGSDGEEMDACLSDNWRRICAECCHNRLLLLFLMGGPKNDYFLTIINDYNDKTIRKRKEAGHFLELSLQESQKAYRDNISRHQASKVYRYPVLRPVSTCIHSIPPRVTSKGRAFAWSSTILQQFPNFQRFLRSAIVKAKLQQCRPATFSPFELWHSGNRTMYRLYNETQLSICQPIELVFEQYRKFILQGRRMSIV